MMISEILKAYFGDEKAEIFYGDIFDTGEIMLLHISAAISIATRDWRDASWRAVIGSNVISHAYFANL